MKTSDSRLGRRTFLKSVAAGSALVLPAVSAATRAAAALPVPPDQTAPATLATDERFWSKVATYYDRTQGIVNLEHGYWGKMAHPVQDAYIEATRRVNAQNSYYARRHFADDTLESQRRIAQALGVHEDEIVLTRNATEAVHNLIRQYNDLESGDAVLWADLDYPDFKTAMQWLSESRDVRPLQLTIPQRADQDRIFELYRDAFHANPELKLILVTHVSNQHGLVVPVARIAAEARQRGIDVICDSAQSWGLLDYKVPALNVDWAGFNLHKWIGTPVGVGALYMRRGSLGKIDPYPGESDPENTRASTRVHMATSNFAAVLAIPDALDFHEAIGPANKEARLRYLRSLWTNEAESMAHIELLGGVDEASWTGMGSFRLAGKASGEDARQLQQRLEQGFGIFTVVRDGLASGYCVRITPQVFTSPDEVAKLVSAMKRLA